eukprot:1897974-Pyramimonas_sp.AAC.1
MTTGTVRSHSGPHKTALRWTSQEPTEVRQFRSSQPPGTPRSHAGCSRAALRWNHSEPMRVATFLQFAAPWDGEASFRSA